ncbi:MAG: copper resistance D family protein [Candidatus Binataceae bacterium]
MTSAISRAIVAWPALIATLAIFGTSAFALILDGRGISRIGQTAILPRMWKWLSGINFCFTLIAVLVATADIAEAPVIAAAAYLPEVLSATHFGRVSIARAAFSIILMAAAIGAQASRRRTRLLCFVSAMILFTQSASSHAYDMGSLTVAIHFLHQVAAGLWIGALGALAIASRSDGARGDEFASLALAVSKAAGWSVALIVATGLLTAYRALGWSYTQWGYSLYGQTLVAKVSVAAAAIALGAYHRWKVVPRVRDGAARTALGRSVAAELLLIAVILATSAMLAHFPPPH